MLFNSVRFAVFFPCVVFFYFLLPHRYRWVLLLAASYYFYMCWKAEYLILILISTAIDYVAALRIAYSPRPHVRTTLLVLSLLGNFGLLFAFKYFNFFNESMRTLFARFNLLYDVPSLRVLLPVGISFYTFQSVSYTIDVYLGRRAPERHLGIFALYVAFFPQLVAGPIERADRLLPQFRESHAWHPEKVVDGLQLMAWGFFKKLVIADRLAVFVNEVFNHAGAYHGAPVWLAAYFFSVQIYCDFSGYSDIAIGAAQVMGFRLIDNFRQPYFAPDIAEFWRRWHISLSTWFRDYVFIPLGGSRVGAVRRYRNLLATFLISGLWHGANWTFLVWGGLHGAYYILSQWTRPMRDRLAAVSGLTRFPVVRQAVRIVITFHMVTFAYIFFRANSVNDAFVTIRSLFAFGDPLTRVRVSLTPRDFVAGIVFAAAMLVVEGMWGKQNPSCGRSPFADRPKWARCVFYYVVVMSVLVFGKFTANPFIYFQF